MDHAEFKRQMLGDFTPDQRTIDLHERLQRYYRDTPDSMSNLDAQPFYEDFKQWCAERGYTNDEIVRAKKNARYRS